MFPTPWTAQHFPYIVGARDENYEPIDSWVETPTEVPVYGWATPGSDAEHEKHRTTVVRDLDLYSPSNPFGPKDRVGLAGDVFEVVGYAEDYNHGPFSFQPGYRINLKRVVELG